MHLMLHTAKGEQAEFMQVTFDSYVCEVRFSFLEGCNSQLKLVLK